MRQLLKTLAADDTDVLNTAGSELRRAPSDGEYRVWYMSDQADGELTITAGGTLVLEKSNMPVATVNQLKVDGPPQVSFKVVKGMEVLINYNEVTGGTATILVKAFDMVDLLLEAGFSPVQIAESLGA